MYTLLIFLENPQEEIEMAFDSLDNLFNFVKIAEKQSVSNLRYTIFKRNEDQ